MTVGMKGQNNLIACGPDLADAKSVFEKKFYDKTRNDWAERNDFEKVPGKYDMLEMDYSTKVRGVSYSDIILIAKKVEKQCYFIFSSSMNNLSVRILKVVGEMLHRWTPDIVCKKQK